MFDTINTKAHHWQTNPLLSSQLHQDRLVAHTSSYPTLTDILSVCEADQPLTYIQCVKFPFQAPQSKRLNAGGTSYIIVIVIVIIILTHVHKYRYLTNK